MKRIKGILVLSLVFAILIPCTVYGARERMSSLDYTSQKQVWIYYTGEEDEQGYSIRLTNQWKQVWDNWYYFDEEGVSKQNTWAEINGKWYYFDEYSIMLHDTTTPDGYYVGSDGAWVQEEATTQ